MNLPYILPSIEWGFAIWALLAIAAGAALLAILSPRRFSALNAWSSAWIDVDKLTRRLDQRVDIEHHVIGHSRMLGAMAVVAACVLATFSLRLQYGGQWVVLGSLGLVGAVGLLGIFSPPLFSRLARWGGTWVDTDRLLARLERRFDIDHYVLRYCRFFGIAVLGAVAVLAGFLLWAP